MNWLTVCEIKFTGNSLPKLNGIYWNVFIITLHCLTFPSAIQTLG